MNGKQLQLDPTVYIGEEGTRFRLCGIICFGGFHFTARIIDMNGQTWYNDGIVTDNTSTLEDPLKMTHRTLLSKARGRVSSVAIYTKLF
ncbi:uncharacterized protein LAESUDRAFT_663522 [Laetiporus sulphureus 93-53]|uniref:Uncharacterized protein n=1 Tax=Laetiporus sulphureus 93-53 TaxID=1314785 RepID=A0A165BU63_9APHY|nr:uncharacterized protein LAESUDRAFT_663522 [Laetiporus sulphureus 93-53]KZT01657.1 hypothetical protein LAESUDRAFT_663522 [Laetiporus sulphureus 93-53]